MTNKDLLNNTIAPKITNVRKSYFDSKEFELIPLAGDASARRYYRVAYKGQTFVLMEWESFTNNNDYPFLSVLNHFKYNNVHVPQVIDLDPDHGLILLEDLGDLTLERKFWESQNQKLIIPFYKLAIDELIKIHYNSSLSNDKTCTAFKMRFDTDKLLWELNYAKNHLLDSLLKLPLSENESIQLQDEFSKICLTLSSEPTYICHRDYHSRNLMLKMGKIHVIDFQDARLGPIQYDLVSLLHDSYVNINEETHETLLQYYFKESSKFYTQPFDREHFDSIYQLQMIQRCFKACGSFSSFFNTREDLRYIHYIQPTLKKIAKTIDSIDSYPQFKKLFTDFKIHEKDYKKICTPSC